METENVNFFVSYGILTFRCALNKDQSINVQRRLPSDYSYVNVSVCLLCKV